MSARVPAVDWHPGTVCPKTGEAPHTAVCGTCARQWCDTCDPTPGAHCHTCTGRGYSTAPIARPAVVWADGFGVWHAVVDVHPRAPGAARRAIREQLSARAPRGVTVPLPRIVRVGYARGFDVTRVEYCEAPR